VQYDVKVRLAQYILEDTGHTVDPSSMFDTHPRIQRQHLNALYILTLYLRLKKTSIYNAARMGRFSSDRAIQEYCKNIWDVKEIR
jgi:glucan phosphorylase